MAKAKALLAAFAFVLAALSVSCTAAEEAMVLPLDPAPLRLKTANGSVELKIEVADNVVERSRGLMFRERLPEGQGMLFVFQEDDLQAFWMKDTPQPLDIVFIESDGDVESILSAKPLDETSLPSRGPVRFVLEIASGEAARLGIVPGSKAFHPLIDAAKANP